LECADKHKNNGQEMIGLMRKLKIHRNLLEMVEKVLTEQEVFALRAVTYGCNMNRRLAGGEFLDVKIDKTMSFKDALDVMYNVIERELKGDEGE
jgi:hypothetical protein